MTSQIEQQESGLQGHLPECPMADPNDRECCCCKELRACKQRVRMEDDDYAYVAAQAEAEGRRRGWANALDAAREAVAAQHLRSDDGQVLRQGGDWEHAVDRALAAIDALREQPADQTGYNLPDAR